LTRVDLFAHLDRVALARLAASAEALPVQPQEEVCRQGDPADGLYVVADGIFGVYATGPDGVHETRIAELRPGDHFGEMALLNNEPRSATVRADGQGAVLQLERARFEELMRHEPEIAHGVAAALSRRLRERDRAPGQSRSRYDPLIPIAPVAHVTNGDFAAALGHYLSDLRSYSTRSLVAGSLAILFGLGALVTQARGGPPQAVFGLLMMGAIAMWTGQLLPDFAVALGLVAAWLVFGLATPAQALAGFGSLTWLFVVTVLALAGAVARSGLMFRAGLLLARRLPSSLGWQTAMLLLTGLVLSPLLPSSTGRSALTGPLALAVAEARRLRDQSPPAALLGMAAWIGATPLSFAFLNASSNCLLAWGLLPEPIRAQFSWTPWMLAALPLTILVCLGSYPMLFAVLRPKEDSGLSQERLQVQLVVLGPLARREKAMLVVLLCTVAGWLLAPTLHVDVAVVGVLGIVAAVATGNLDRRALQQLDWNFLVFFGVILSLTGIVGGLGLDRVVADQAGALLARINPGPVGFVLLVLLAGILVELVLGKTQMLVVLGLALIPLAPSVGVNPWVVAATLIAGPSLWFLPGQQPSYPVAVAATEGRLYSVAQSRAVALGYGVVVLVALVLTLPYWSFIGLL
jgi:CRP-like cAMP-binding protein/di/tricarboxylate transporter